MFGGYKFGRGGASGSGMPEGFCWLFLAAMYALAVGLIVRLLVRLGQVAPQNETSAWFKGMALA